MPLTDDQLARRKERLCERPDCIKAAVWIVSRIGDPLDAWRLCDEHSEAEPEEAWHKAKMKVNL